MARLTAKQRRALPASSFAYPAARKYPLDTKNRAYVALREAGRSNTFGTYSHVRAAVNRKFPSLRGKGPGSGKKR